MYVGAVTLWGFDNSRSGSIVRDMRREQNTKYAMTRTHDFGGFRKITVGLDLEARGGVFSPAVFAWWNVKADTPAGYTRKGGKVLLPALKWGRAYRLRKYGALRVYDVQQRAYLWIVGFQR